GITPSFAGMASRPVGQRFTASISILPATAAYDGTCLRNASPSHLLRRGLHAAVLVLLAAPARARIVAADLVHLVAERLDLLPFAQGVRLLGADVVGGGEGPRGLGVGRGADLPDRFLEALVVLQLEDRLGHLLGDPFPHRVEFLHALPLVL